MNKTFYVAWREFVATVLTKGFMLGIFLPPVLITVAIAAMSVLMKDTAPKVSGKVAVIDRSGAVLEQLKDEFTPEKLAERGRRQAQQAKEQAEKMMPGAGAKMDQAAAMMPKGPDLSLEPLAADADVDAAKKEIPTTSRKSDIAKMTQPRLALAVIPPEAVTGTTTDKGTTYGQFDLFSAPTLDPEVKSTIEGALNRSIVDARLASSGLDVAKVRGLLATPQSKDLTVTESGERKTNDAAKMLIPGAFLMLIWISVFTAGQYLLTSTIEEKSNRVMEVLLSAVSPMQLMVGKILGQMAVGGVILGVYASVGMIALISFAMMDMIDPMNIVYLVLYFFIAFFLIASMMAAVGSAVSDVREAQSLMGPIMIVLVIPMMLWFPILRNPNSGFATACSFIPPISPFIMVLRISGSEPVPFWQIPATILLGAVYAAVFAWGAAKIFRIGVLMYGKPPNLRTLIQWIRLA
jgi:ABC-2 type transport system permease protein